MDDELTSDDGRPRRGGRHSGPLGQSRPRPREKVDRRVLGAVDVHHHMVPPVLRAALVERAARDGSFARQFASALTTFAHELDDVDDRLRAMDAAGVETAVLAAPPPAAEVVVAPKRPALTRRVNEELLDLADRYPGRFVVALALPMPDAAESAGEVGRLGDEGRVRAVSLLVHLRGVPLDEPVHDELFGACAARGLLILLHPGLDAIADMFDDWQLASAVGAPLTTTLAAARLALSGALDRHVDLDVVVPHLGGVAPYLLQRLEDQCSPGSAARPLVDYFRERFYYDTCSFHPPALECARQSVGIERLLLGSDYPFRGNIARAVEDVRELGEEAARRVAALAPARWISAPGARAAPGVAQRTAKESRSG